MFNSYVLLETNVSLLEMNLPNMESLMSPLKFEFCRNLFVRSFLTKQRVIKRDGFPELIFLRAAFFHLALFVIIMKLNTHKYSNEGEVKEYIE